MQGHNCMDCSVAHGSDARIRGSQVQAKQATAAADHARAEARDSVVKADQARADARSALECIEDEVEGSI